MHFTTITTLLLPLLLSSVLAAPTSVLAAPTSTTPQVGNPNALKPRGLSCADGFSAYECDPNEDDPPLPSATLAQILNSLPPGTSEFSDEADDLIAQAQENQDGDIHPQMGGP